ncbi:MAG TPA: fibronectin type III domain-containing protein, partial [Gammaproteobacteria bacterium]|nr:fibronectin type III domain-containing protein [Gammaproteobacteria bacterium]
ANTGGQSAWAGPWQFRTIPPPPTTPDLMSPTEGAQDQPTTLSVIWHTVPRAATYHLQVAGDPAFTSLIRDLPTLPDSQVVVSELDHATSYYWRVRASNSGGTSSWSPPWQFTTIIAAPQVPVLLSPADGATDQPLNLTVVWQPAALANRYHLQVAADAGFGDPLVDVTDLTLTEHAMPPLAYQTTYYWRVRAANTGGTSSWSPSRQFTTVPEPPPAPALVAPADNATDQPATCTLSWQAAERAASYHLQVATDAGFTDRIVDNAGLTDLSATVTNLDRDRTYYWRVRAANTGGQSAWAGPWQFTTIIAAPSVPPPLSPADGAPDQPLALTVAWQQADRASEYHLQVASDPGFDTPLVDTTGITVTEFSLPPLAYYTTYYWRVRASNIGGISSWSAINEFTTFPRLVPPALISPADGANEQLINSLSLQWNTAEYASSYRVQVATDSGFTDPTVNVSSSDPSYILTNLAPETTHYWRICSVRGDSTSSWSSFREFTTHAILPPPKSFTQWV